MNTSVPSPDSTQRKIILVKNLHHAMLAMVGKTNVDLVHPHLASVTAPVAPTVASHDIHKVIVEAIAAAPTPASVASPAASVASTATGTPILNSYNSGLSDASGFTPAETAATASVSPDNRVRTQRFCVLL